jgi:MarR family transcriptional regulator for hemolysin
MLLTDIVNLATLKSYAVGLHQAKAYRILKHVTARVLTEYELSPLEWACVGLLFDHKKGLRISAIAQSLGVETPLVSVLIDQLTAKKIVAREIDPTDRRVKTISLTPMGKQLVAQIERKMRLRIKPLLAGVKAQDLVGYLKVLQAIATNYQSS